VDANGVPCVVLPPAGGPRAGAPVVVAWHPLDAPGNERDFAAAVPLAGLDAWRVYVGLPLSGSRMPAGGAAEIQRRIQEDVVLRLHRHVVEGALAEFPGAFAAIRREFGIADGVPVGVLGGSMGAAAAQLVMAEGGVPVRAAVLINPVTRMRETIDALSRRFGATYGWTAASTAFAARTDFAARAEQVGGTGTGASGTSARTAGASGTSARTAGASGTGARTAGASGTGARTAAASGTGAQTAAASGTSAQTAAASGTSAQTAGASGTGPGGNGAGRTAIRYVTGADDLPDAFLEPVAATMDALRAAGAVVDHRVVPGMAHSFYDEEAGRPTPQAAVVDRLAVEWFERHL
jgi:pimeloyl-ACP methyl ester carboxylesterase